MQPSNLSGSVDIHRDVLWVTFCPCDAFSETTVCCFVREIFFRNTQRIRARNTRHLNLILSDQPLELNTNLSLLRDGGLAVSPVVELRCTLSFHQLPRSCTGRASAPKVWWPGSRRVVSRSLATPRCMGLPVRTPWRKATSRPKQDPVFVSTSVIIAPIRSNFWGLKCTSTDSCEWIYSLNPQIVILLGLLGLSAFVLMDHWFGIRCKHQYFSGESKRRVTLSHIRPSLVSRNLHAVTVLNTS